MDSAEYLAALAAHDPGRLPVAPGVKSTENDQPLPLGAGEWQISGPPGRNRHVFAEPASGTAGYWVTKENGTTGVLALRVNHGRRYGQGYRKEGLPRYDCLSTPRILTFGRDAGRKSGGCTYE